MVTTGEQLPYQGQILVSNSPVRYSQVSNSPYPHVMPLKCRKSVGLVYEEYL